MEQTILNNLKKSFDLEVISVIKIPTSGSDRINYIIETKDKKLIYTISENQKETDCFVYFSKLLNQNKISSPEIIFLANDRKSYVQTCVGDENLLEILQKNGFSEKVKNLYYNSLDELYKFQSIPNDQIDYNECFDFQEFNEKLILHDLYYFKNYFLDFNFPNYQKSKLLEEFHRFSHDFQTLKPIGLMFRDFQSRNIMILDEKPYFIDYQGAMKGNMLYDFVSLIWQAKAEIPADLKALFKNYYFAKIQKNNPTVSLLDLENSYQYCTIIRLLQVLGAYGFRGLVQKKAHFLSSIHLGQKNLKSLISDCEILNNYPYLKELIAYCSENLIEIPE